MTSLLAAKREVCQCTVLGRMAVKVLWKHCRSTARECLTGNQWCLSGDRTAISECSESTCMPFILLPDSSTLLLVSPYLSDVTPSATLSVSLFFYDVCSCFDPSHKQPGHHAFGQPLLVAAIHSRKCNTRDQIEQQPCQGHYYRHRHYDRC